MSEKNNPNILGEQLKRIRVKKDLSQKELAELLGVTPASLSAYETGKKNPSLNVLIDIAKKCNVSLDWLCGLSQYENNLNEIKTYSDIIKLLTQISKTKLIDFTDIYMVGACISFRENSALKLFLNDFKKMYTLYTDKSIDEDVYDLWIEKTLKKYNYAIDTNFDDNDNYDDEPF